MLEDAGFRSQERPRGHGHVQPVQLAGRQRCEVLRRRQEARGLLRRDQPLGHQEMFYGGALVIAVCLSQLVRGRQEQQF